MQGIGERAHRRAGRLAEPGASLGYRPDDGEERFELVAVGRPVVPDPVVLRSVHDDRRSARDPDALFPRGVPLLRQHLEVDAVRGRGDGFEQRALGRRGGARHVGRVVEQGDRVGQPAHPVIDDSLLGLAQRVRVSSVASRDYGFGSRGYRDDRKKRTSDSVNPAVFSGRDFQD